MFREWNELPSIMFLPLSLLLHRLEPPLIQDPIRRQPLISCHGNNTPLKVPHTRISHPPVHSTLAKAMIPRVLVRLNNNPGRCIRVPRYITFPVTTTSLSPRISFGIPKAPLSSLTETVG
ncbi:hypothetical protein BJX68DRAFT_105744 [Aspergillus pseudodeflectus]|uniref:Uncharacterized protein n=1 Tax=Aspergillus pseudodeflectus TaxID=176178 RepID=A0ABR4K6I0_9EURO